MGVMWRGQVFKCHSPNNSSYCSPFKPLLQGIPLSFLHLTTSASHLKNHTCILTCSSNDSSRKSSPHLILQSVSFHPILAYNFVWLSVLAYVSPCPVSWLFGPASCLPSSVRSKVSGASFVPRNWHRLVALEMFAVTFEAQTHQWL